MRKDYALYAITVHGLAIMQRLKEALPEADCYVSEKLMHRAGAGVRPMPLPMGPTLEANFKAYNCHVFIVSVGAVVRMIAPLLENKKVDPAIVCVDDAHRFAICALSGHVGRGNAFTERIADILDAIPVVTTASDARGTLTVDILGRDLGWTLEDADRNVTRACAAVVNAAPVCFVQETGEPHWWPADKDLPPGVDYRMNLEEVDPAAYEILLIASDRELRDRYPTHFAQSVIYRPKSLVLGIGCDRNTSPDMLERGVLTLLADAGLAKESVKEIASVDLKGDEPALLRLGEKYGWPLRLHTAEALDALAVPNPSETVERHVGTRGVAEPAALLTAEARTLVLTKQKYTEPDAGRWMTLAVARIPFAPRPQGVTAHV